MAIFAYRAMRSPGRTVRGTIAADTPRDARDLLRAQGFVVQAVVVQQSAGESEAKPAQWRLWGRRHSVKVAHATRELGTLLEVGVPLTEALDTLCRQHRGSFRTSIMLLRDRVSNGGSLAEAMAEQPLIFDSVSVRMVEVGENAGNLHAVLIQLADFRERGLELKDRVLTALLYPAIVFAVGLCVSIFLMAVVVPMLLSSLLEAGRSLPWPTRVAKSISDLLIDHGGLMAVALSGVIAVVAWVLRTKTGRRLWDRAFLQLPIVGPMSRKQTISRISFIISTLMRSGIVYLSAVEIAARSMRNQVFREALEESGRAVAAGRDIGPALEEARVFPPMVVQIFSIGQQSGKLDSMLQQLATNYDQQVARDAARLAAALEPILILLLAVFVGFVLFATLLPILDAGNVL